MKKATVCAATVSDRIADKIPVGTFHDGDEIPPGTFHHGDEIPPGTFHDVN
jgi:hypothetical protein